MSTPAPFPHRYEVHLRGSAEGAVFSGSPRPVLLGGPPPEFGGRDDRWSPEHLLLASLNLCLSTTFDAFARRAGVSVNRYESRAEAVLDKTADGLVFTSFVIHLQIEAPGPEAGRITDLVQSAKKHCLVSRALRTPVEVRLEVKAVP